MILRSYRAAIADEQHIHRNLETSSGYTILADIVFHTPNFLDFQTQIIDEALATISDALEADDLLYDDAVAMFESAVKQINHTLEEFSQSMDSVPFFDLRGCIMLSRFEAFVSAVIGDVSLLLARRGLVGYTMHNEVGTTRRCTLFSDVVEGDLQPKDQLFFIGADLDHIIDRDEQSSLVHTGEKYAADQALGLWYDALSTRADADHVGMIAVYSLAGDVSKTKTSRAPATAGVSKVFGGIGARIASVWELTMDRLSGKLQQKQFAVLLAIGAAFLLFTMWSIVHSWFKNTAAQHINDDGTITASLSIEDIKKEIAAFQKLDPTSDLKATKYNAIIKELQRIQADGKRASDVQQLKKIIDTEYYQGFNIITFDALQDQMVYAFSTLELSALEKPLQLFVHKGLHIAGTHGAVLAGISNDIRGTTVRSDADGEMTTCNLDLLKSGLFCATSKNTLLHLSKVGTENIGGETVVFPGSVAGIATFGSANMYLLTSDPLYTKDKTYIMKYTNVLGSQNTYGSSTLLPLVDTAAEDDFAQGLSSFAIDGTFLAWSVAKKTLMQMYRNPQDKALTSREVPLKGGVTLGQGFSDSVKVMTTPGTRYVYLYDRANHALSVYISSPAKNADAFATNYSLDYVMRADFSKMGTPPRDVVVDESDGKQTAYVLVDAGVAKVPLSDLLDALKKSRTQQAAQ